MRTFRMLVSIGLLSSIFALTQTQGVQVPPTDLSRGTEQPGTIAHTTYQVNARTQYPNAHLARPTTDFGDNAVTPFESGLSSLPPEQVNLADIPTFTNYIVLEGPELAPMASGQPRGASPSDIRTAYAVTNSGSGTIAIVDAFNYPSAVTDLQIFDTQFNLPCNNCLKVVPASGTLPPTECNWAGEAALDVQWTHAMAPNAQIVLVEAKSSMMQDMLEAVDFAANLVSQAGGGQVSLSWGGREFSTEGSLDSHFVKTGVVFVASSGDVGGLATYPSESPNVVAVGGTTLPSGGQTEEKAWAGSGGGPSAFEAKPSFQTGVTGTDAHKRSAPDVAADADPFTGVAVFDSTACQGRSGWQIIGGTSLAAPLVAAMINDAHSGASGSQPELTKIYANAGDPTKFRDIVSGTAGSFTAAKGYDFITGVGVPLDSNFDK